ncbi:hypothetical protein [Actinocrinis sp.]|uniref:hypothetical protein n=1 Tax=Actinocrinis sp. TaxID=1920516 RepID=UPI002DDD1C34|nr:hypothetical protein [Actinocrinis sp.]
MNPTMHQPRPSHATTHVTPTSASLDALAKPTRVVLRLWGCTDADVELAEENARHWRFSSTWDIVEVIPSTGTPCPIPRNDPIALKQNAEYDAAWAAYRATGAPP